MAQNPDWRGGAGAGRFRAGLGPVGPIREEFRRPPDKERWRAGHWVHDWHNHKFGWWWVVDPFWYPYAKPVHPYPAYVDAIPPGPMPASGFWYYCDNPPGYYPNIPACQGGWYWVAPKAPGSD